MGIGRFQRRVRGIIARILEENKRVNESFCKQEIGIDPEVLGYQILVKSPVLEEKTKAGILIPSDTIKDQQRRQNIGLILKIGPSAFQDRCSDRECKVGEWVAYSNFERVPLCVGNHILYYISDAHVLARYTKEDVEFILKTFK